MTEVLGPSDVEAALARESLAWRREGDVLVKEVDCVDFAGALAYVNLVGELSERANHHPDVDIRWRTVVLRLTTHSEGGITERDLSLAARIDAIGPRRS
ncbi:MAG: 4a-hydroxytetrahydrobiopterin dehydratase [Actinomycetota bacterium]|nr:4a-hydroxytetrahydrobiopterin dehydratase [Actinomycetota bacterium]